MRGSNPTPTLRFEANGGKVRCLNRLPRHVESFGRVGQSIQVPSVKLKVFADIGRFFTYTDCIF